MQRIEPATPSEPASQCGTGQKANRDAQVVRNRSAPRILRIRRGRPILIRIAESSSVHKPKCLGVIQQRVEHRLRVEDSNTADVFRVLLLERGSVRLQCGIIACD